MSAELIPLKPDQHAITFVPRRTAELPFFNLTNFKRNLPSTIKFEGLDEAGHPINWEVYANTSKEIGAPGVEAHRVWYLLVKPAIDEARQPGGRIPEVIPLGRVRECLRRSGFTAGGHQEGKLIKALNQIGAAWCVADLWIPSREIDEEGRQKFLQVKGRFSRMSVYAIGEHHLTEGELKKIAFSFDPDDIIYIKLDPLEARLQEAQDQRVYDNEYWFSVDPAGRRWYELLAPKIFGTVKNKAPFFEIRYSWYVKHHHTLKQYYERRRVVEQMNIIAKDHLDNGYISKVEYRKVKEPDQELDFIIRYYPGEGAKESIARIQGHIHRKKNQQKLAAAKEPEESQPADPGQGREAQEEQPTETLALSVITATDEHLIGQLVTEFGVLITKAYELVTTKREAVILQLEAWPFRDTKPRNRAGWIIQAIEGNYAAPVTYLQEKLKQQEREKLEEAQAATRACAICAGTGYRRVKSDKYPNGAMKKCTHDPAIESKIESA